MNFILFLLLLLVSAPVTAQEIPVSFVTLDDAFFEKPDPFAAQWSTVAAQKITLLPQNITTPSVYQTSVSSLNVKTIHNGKWLAVLLVWDDPTKDIHVSHDHFSDACAIQFPVKDANVTSPFMGSQDAPVTIIHWKAIWQNDVEKGYQKVADLYPNTWIDSDRFGKSIAIDAKNPIAHPERKVPVEELMAKGFGTLTSQSTQDALGWGVWKNRQWHVVISRKMKTMDATAIAFALWEGGHQDVGARKNYAPWIPFTVEKKQ